MALGVIGDVLVDGFANDAGEAQTVLLRDASQLEVLRRCDAEINSFRGLRVVELWTAPRFRHRRGFYARRELLV
jgi:hypothetical protein